MLKIDDVAKPERKQAKCLRVSPSAWNIIDMAARKKSKPVTPSFLAASILEDWAANSGIKVKAKR